LEIAVGYVALGFAQGARPFWHGGRREEVLAVRVFAIRLRNNPLVIAQIWSHDAPAKPAVEQSLGGVGFNSFLGLAPSLLIKLILGRCVSLLLLTG
jgi:hypothetical protein